MINNEKKKRIWPIVLILFICVGITTFTLMNRLNLFMENDTGAIELAPEESGIAAAETSDETGGEVQPEYNFSVEDGEKVWSTDTHVEMFKVSYVNGEEQITVNSENGNQIIAPGTDSKYTFKFKNTGDLAVDYDVTISGTMTPDSTTAPIEAKLYRYDNKWFVGEKAAFGDFSELASISDSATLGAGRYTYYTLEWQWPFESGDDEYDTFLGNMSVTEDVVFTITIKAVATESVDPYNTGGILIPKTGDSGNMILWIILFGCSLLMIALLLFGKREKDEEEK